MSILPLEFEEIDGDLQGVLKPIVDRLGYFGAFFQYGAHAPDVLTKFMQMSGALKASLADDVNETIALTVCTAMDFPYERIQHERLSEKLGFDRDWIGYLIGKPVTAELTPLQQVARDLSQAIVSGQYDVAEHAVARAAELDSQKTAIAMLFQATRFMQVCAIGRVLGMEIAVPSIFAAE